MPSPEQQHDADWINQQMERYLLGEMTDQEIEQLESAMLDRPDAVKQGVQALEFAAMVREVFREGAERRGILQNEPAVGDFDQLFAELLKDEVQADADLVNYLSPQPAPRPERHVARPAIEPQPRDSFTRSFSRGVLVSGVAAALLLSAVLVVGFLRDAPSSDSATPIAQTPPTPAAPAALPVAKLMDQRDATWTDATGATVLSVGEALAESRDLTLVEGFAQVRFDNGAEVILEGPVKFTPIDSGRVLLRYGKLVAHCPTPQSKGFVVQTPTASVVDIGTTFGVAHSRDTQVRVIDGEITVASDLNGESAEPTRMTSGQAVSVEAGTGQIEPDYAPTERFVSDWGAIAEPPMLEGQIQFDTSLPTALGLGMVESEMIQLFPEWSGLELDKRAVVTFSEASRHDSPGLRAFIEPGTVVDSYIVHLDLPGDLSVESKRRVATIRFASPVLGVVAIEEHLKRSDRDIGRKDCLYASMYPDSNSFGFDLNKHATTDAVTISDDRRTLTLELYGGIAIDQLRIFVQAGD